jgi:hypothetical protein
MTDPSTTRSPAADEGNPTTVDQPELDTESGAGGFLPTDPARLGFESVFVRLVATAGIVAVGTAVAAILGASDVTAWIIGLVVSALSVALAAVLWRSRRL